MGPAKTRASREQLAKAMSKAQRRSHETLLPRMGAKVDGRWTLHDAPPALFHIHGDSTLFSPEDDWMRLGHWTELTDHLYSGYLTHAKPDVRALLGRFRMQDLVFKVVGVGSVGTRCLVLLLTDATDAPMMLQIKQANASVLAHYVPGKSPHIKHQGERVVAGQRLMQATSDRFLGATTGPSGRHFYVRQLRDMKISAEVETSMPFFWPATAPCAARCWPGPTPKAVASLCRSVPTWARAARSPRRWWPTPRAMPTRSSGTTARSARPVEPAASRPRPKPTSPRISAPEGVRSRAAHPEFRASARSKLPVLIADNDHPTLGKSTKSMKNGPVLERRGTSSALCGPFRDAQRPAPSVGTITA
jgi:hypothetical protein